MNAPTSLALPNESKPEKRIVTIEKNNQTFVQSLESVADQLGIEIAFHGVQPAMKRDILIRHFDLDRVILQIMRLYEVENNAIVYNAENETLVKVDIYGCASAVNFISTKTDGYNTEGDNDSALTDSQMDQLLAKNSQLPKDDDSPLTPDQIRRLQEKYAVQKIIDQKAEEPLTPEQIERLNEKSELSKMEEAEAIEPLTSDQLEQLREKSDQLGEVDIDQDPEPFTEDELRLLNEKAEKQTL